MRKLIKGIIVTANARGNFRVRPKGALLVEDGVVREVFDRAPDSVESAVTLNYGDALIIPAFMDTHLHAPQYPMAGMGMDLPLLKWLEHYTFRLEGDYADPIYARAVYSILAHDLMLRGTTRVCIFSTIHTDATLILMEELEKAGVEGYVGKVAMDRNCPVQLREPLEKALPEHERWLAESARFKHVSPVITPRFTPSCTDALMEALGKLAQKYSLPVQSHLSENLDECAWVRELCPDCDGYWQTYARWGLFNERTVMAHCVHPDERELEALLQNRVLVAHSADSNTNLASGIAPIRRMLNMGIRVSVSTDVAGGASLSVMDAVTAAIRASKLRTYYSDGREPFLTFGEAFHMATASAAEFFNTKPNFAVGEPLHALVLTDAALPPFPGLSAPERLERMVYRSDERSILARLVRDRVISM